MGSIASTFTISANPLFINPDSDHGPHLTDLLHFDKNLITQLFGHTAYAILRG
jgi:hypothetical protein